MAESLSKIVAAKTRQGRVFKGKVEDFKPASGNLHLTTNDGKALVLALSGLKGIFFLRPSGTRPIEESVLRPGAVKVRVDFADGEILTGYTYGTHPEQPGFFVYPVGKADQNERVYVVRENALKIAIGG